MRAKLVYEKFKVESDPVSDMNIGIKSMSLEEIAKFTADAFKSFGITVFYRTYHHTPGEIYFDLFDNIIQEEIKLPDFSFSNAEASKRNFEDQSGIGWFIHGIGMKETTLNINDIIRIILSRVYGDKEGVEKRVKYLKNVIKYYEQNP